MAKEDQGLVTTPRTKAGHDTHPASNQACVLQALPASPSGSSCPKDPKDQGFQTFSGKKTRVAGSYNISLSGIDGLRSYHIMLQNINGSEMKINNVSYTLGSLTSCNHALRSHGRISAL